MRNQRTYVGLNHDGMSPTANIILDAQVFGLLPEHETCEGWNIGRIDALYDKVTQSWQPYGHLVSRLPDELRERHTRIYEKALQAARARGWDPGIDDED